jgi:hypothetical protein
MTPLEGEAKLGAPCRKILQHVKITCKYKKILRKAKFTIPFARFSCLLPDDFAGRNKNKKFTVRFIAKC